MNETEAQVGVLVEVKPRHRVDSKKIREAIVEERSEIETSALLHALVSSHSPATKIGTRAPGTKAARLERRRSRVKAGAKSRARNRR